MSGAACYGLSPGAPEHAWKSRGTVGLQCVRCGKLAPRKVVEALSPSASGCGGRHYTSPLHSYGLTANEKVLQCRKCGLKAPMAAVLAAGKVEAAAKALAPLVSAKHSHRCQDVPLSAFVPVPDGETWLKRCPECGKLWTKGTVAWPDGPEPKPITTVKVPSLSAVGNPGGPLTRRFINTLPGHSKFWNVTLQGRNLVCHWGRIGTDGQKPLVKDCVTEFRAERAMWKLIREKVGEGYMELTPAGVPFVPDAEYLEKMEQAANAKMAMDVTESAAEATAAFKSASGAMSKFGLTSAKALAQMAGAIKWGAAPDTSLDAFEALVNAGMVEEVAVEKPKPRAPEPPAKIPVVERRGRKIRF